MAAMPFERVMREIVGVATRLEANGWLAEILGAWQKNCADVRLTIVEKILDEVGSESRSSLVVPKQAPSRTDRRCKQVRPSMNCEPCSQI